MTPPPASPPSRPRPGSWAFAPESDAAEEALLCIAPDARIVRANDAACRALGYAPEELVGLSIADIDVEFDAALWPRHLERLKRAGSLTFESTHVTKDGRRFPVELAAQHAEHEGHACTRLLVRDTTERKQREEELRAAKSQLAATLDAIPDLMFELDQDGRYHDFWSPRTDLLAAPKEVFLGKTVREIMPPPVAAVCMAALREAGETGSSQGKQFELQLPHGAFWFELSVSRKAAGPRGEARFIVLSRDITERKRAETALREREAQLERILGATHDAILAVDRSGKVLRTNQRFAELWRLPQALLETRDDEALLAFVLRQLAEPEAFRAKVQELYGSDDETTDTVRFADGRLVERFTAPLLLDGVNLGRVWSFRDVTAREQAEEALTESRNLLQSVIDTAPIRVFWKDKDLRYLGCNPAFAADAGHARPSDVVGQDDFAMGWAARAERYRADDRAVLATGVPKLAYEEPVTAAGEERWLRTSKVPLRDRRGEVIGLLGVYEDVTEHVRAARRLSMAIDVAALVFWEYDVASDLFTVDVRLLGGLGLSPEQPTGTVAKWMALVHPDDRAHLGEMTARGMMPDGPELDAEYRVLDPTGKAHWVHSRGRVTLRDSNGFALKAVGTSMSITARKAHEEALRESEARFRTLANTAPVFIWIADAAGQCTWLNQRWLAFTGRSLEEELADGWTRGMHPEDRARVGPRYREALGRGEAFTVEFRHLRHDGVYRSIAVEGVPRFAADGRFDGYVGSCLDVTERMDTERAQIAARVAAESASRAKSEFLANMSHELRTPLNGVLGNIQLLEMSNVDEAQKKHLSAIALSGKNLLSLINDILDLSKIEADKLVLGADRFSLRTCVRNAVWMERARASEKGLSLEVRIADDVPDGLVGDELRLRQILLNLLSNAVKFTRVGWIIVSAAVESQGDGRVRLELSVTDTGIGVPSSLAASIFEPFVQADSSITRRYGGTGLGLAICRRLASLMGGELSVESVVGAGSTFRVVLPFSLGQGDAPAKETPTSAFRPPTAKASLRILLAEDDEGNRQLEVALLEKMGHEVTAAEHGADALRALEKGTFDLVLMDIQMPVMDGREALRALRAREGSGTRMPVIAITAYAARDEEEGFLAAGFDGYVRKPVDWKELSKVISEVQERSA